MRSAGLRRVQQGAVSGLPPCRPPAPPPPPLLQLLCAVKDGAPRPAPPKLADEEAVGEDPALEGGSRLDPGLQSERRRRQQQRRDAGGRSWGCWEGCRDAAVRRPLHPANQRCRPAARHLQWSCLSIPAAGHVPAWWVFDPLSWAAPHLLLPAAPRPGMQREQAAAAKCEGGSFCYII